MDILTDTILEDADKIIKNVDLSKLVGRSVLVTGATGIIGTYVTAVLKRWGLCGEIYTVASKEPEFNTVAHSIIKGTRFIPTDLSTHSDFGLTPYDYCFYGAGYGQPAKFTDDPLKTIAINTTGLMSTLETMWCGGRMLYASSSEIYSGNRKPPFREDEVGTTNPQNFRGCYIEGKRCGEAICAAYNRRHRTAHAVSARIALAYGPGTRKDDERVLNEFIRSALLYKKIDMKDEGYAIRNYCYIADTVELLLHVWLSGSQTVYNVGGNTPITIAELARTIGRICDVPVTVGESSGGYQSAPQVVTMDTRLVGDEFKKENYVSMEHGLRRTIEWAKILYGKV